MNYGPLIFLGVFFTFACSWLGMVFTPQSQLGNQQSVKLVETGEFYPSGRLGASQQGAQIYRANGCASCHSQQVRGNVDIPRWGKRYSAPQDYLNDNPVMLGSQRIGPDLSNIGARLPDVQWQLKHLYNPQVTSPKSSMPPYRFLFEKRKIGRTPSLDALSLPEPYGPEKGFEIVPKAEARALVAYLMSLKSDVSLFEAPLPKPGKAGSMNAPAATTNAAPVTTNSPAK